MHHRENIIIVKREKRMTDFLGHSNIFATLSLRRSPTVAHTLLRFAGTRVNIRLSMQSGNRRSSERRAKLACALPSRDGGRA